MNNASGKKFIPVEEMSKLSPTEMQEYLGLTPQQYTEMDTDTKKALMEAKADELQGHLRRIRTPA